MNSVGYKELHSEILYYYVHNFTGLAYSFQVRIKIWTINFFLCKSFTYVWKGVYGE